MIVFFTGPSGVGKTTLARAWAESRGRPTAFIDADTVMGFLRNGSQAAVVLEGRLDGRIEMYRINRDVWCAMARVYARNGLDVAIAHLYGKAPPESPWAGDTSDVDSLEPIFVVLYPVWATIAERLEACGRPVEAARESYGFDWQVWHDDPRAMMLDTTGMSVSDSVTEVDRLLSQRFELS